MENDDVHDCDVEKSILRMGWGGGDLGECQQREKSDKRGDEMEQ